MKLYSIFDRVAQLHLPPFVAPNDETAKRRLRGAVNGGDKNLTEHHVDYDMFVLASFDENTGLIVGVQPISHVCTASSLKEKEV